MSRDFWLIFALAAVTTLVAGLVLDFYEIVTLNHVSLGWHLAIQVPVGFISLMVYAWLMDRRRERH